jgi:uncharacterized protein (DUF58 family)
MTAAVSGSPLLDPATLAGIRDLRLAARRLVEGFLAGHHVSRRLAAAAEFSQFRAYEPGDDPRRIDWRLYARTDRYYLREAHVERDVTVRFVLDATASMAAPDDGTAGKFATARLATAALAYLAHLQGDRVVLAAVGGGSAGGVSGAGGGERGLGGFLHALERLEPGGAWPRPEELLPRLAPRHGRELIVMLSDAWERGAEVRRTLAMLSALRHEVLLLRVLSPLEVELPDGDDTVFEDVETGARVAAGGTAARAAYHGRFAAHGEALRRDLLAAGVALTELRTDQPLDAALRSLLLQRQRLR